jgi:prevent-host-death family protein
MAWEGIFMPISITKLRADLYKIVDQVIETGLPIEIERHGQKVQIIAVDKKSKLANLKSHPGTIIGNPEDYVHIDWSSEWNEGENL